MGADQFEEAQDQADLTRVNADLHRRLNKARADNRTLRQAVKDAETERDETSTKLAVYEHIADADTDPPSWTVRKKARSKRHRGIACLLVTDTHFDEVVRPGEVDNFNAYNRKIGEKRLQKAFEKACILARDHITGIDYDGACVMLGGDIVTGYIHDELARNVDDTLAGTVVHWTDRLAAGLKMMADEFGNVFVPAVVGNHDRQGRKPQAKQRAKDSYTWILYHWLADKLRDDDRISFQITEAADATFDLYDTTYLLTHGDQFRGGSGIAGALSPLMLGQHRKTRRQDVLGRPHDVMVMGHWHQYIALPNLIVGNTLKGYDEYAYVSNFVPSEASQAFWVTTPEHGPTFHAQVYVQNRKDESW